MLVAGAGMAIEVCRSSAIVGALRLRKNWRSHIDASHSRQPLVKGERLVRHEVNAVMPGPQVGNKRTNTFDKLNASVALQLIPSAAPSSS